MITTKNTKEDEVAKAIVDAALLVHRTLDPSLLESVYEKCLAAELVERAHSVEVQQQIPIAYRNLRIEAGFRADLLVEGCVLVELKAVETLLDIHTAQVLTYLKLTKLHIALLINFNTTLLKNGIKRLAY